VDLRNLTQTLNRSPRPDQLKHLKLLAGRFPNDPVGYCHDYLGQILFDKQQEIARLLLKPPYRCLVRSANKQGKTFLLGALANWHHDQWDPGVVMITGPTKRQVRDTLFKEIRKLRPFDDGFYPKDTRLESSPSHFIHGFTTKSGDAFQGQHEGRLFLMFDEATGVDRTYWDRGGTMFNGEATHKWVAGYNPNDVTSYAYSEETSGDWHVVVLNALEHPNIEAELRGLPPPFPAAIRLSRVLKRIEKECDPCGRTKADDSCFEFPKGSGFWFKPMTIEFEAQILGRWPSSSFDGVWSKEVWESCLRRVEIPSTWPTQIGCDVARFGRDKTAMAVRRGIALVHLEVRSGWTTKQIAERLRELAKQYAPPGVDPKRVPVLVDDTGGYGAGVVDYPEGYRFIGVNASEKSLDQLKYPRKRSELWWTTRQAADQGGLTIGNVQVGKELAKQLGEEYLGVKYSLDHQGRRQIEGKDHTRERLGRSPDIADAVNLSWYPY
jgi:hypothetical protein